MVTLRKAIILVVSATIVSASAHAAQLLEVSGTVLVNRGEGFKPAAGPAALKPGDRVLVRRQGSARVAYGADCIAHIKANQTFVVPSEAVCRTGAVGGSLKDGLSTAGSTGMGTEDVVIGGLILGGAGAAIALTGGNNPASP